MLMCFSRWPTCLPSWPMQNASFWQRVTDNINRMIKQGSLKTRIDLLYSSSPLAYIKLIKNKKNFCFSKRAIFGEKLYQGNYFVVTWQSIRSLQWSLDKVIRTITRSKCASYKILICDWSSRVNLIKLTKW